MEVSFDKEHVITYLEGKRLNMKDNQENRDRIDLLDEIIDHIQEMK